MDLTGKNALVTGSTSGIGLGIAKALAKSGARVILNGFGDIEAAIEQVSQLGQKAEFEGADLMNVSEIEQMVANIEHSYGGVDILVNNAGIQHVAALEEFPPEQWDRIIALNLSAVFHTSRLVLPQMRKRGFGRIINIASTHGLVASKGKAAYVAAKHGVVGLTKVTALETAQSNVTCNAICPGWVLTPLVQKQIDQRVADGMSEEEASAALLGEKQPSMEFVTPEQLGELALFLCSEGAAQVRGATWAMDGGWTAQ